MATEERRVLISPHPSAECVARVRALCDPRRIKRRRDPLRPFTGKVIPAGFSLARVGWQMNEPVVETLGWIEPAASGTRVDLLFLTRSATSWRIGTLLLIVSHTVGPLFRMFVKRDLAWDWQMSVEMLLLTLNLAALVWLIFELRKPRQEDEKAFVWRTLVPALDGEEEPNVADADFPLPQSLGEGARGRGPSPIEPTNPLSEENARGVDPQVESAAGRLLRP